MKSLIQILPEKINPNQINLFCEIRRDGLTYFFENDESKMIEGLAVVDFDNNNDEYETSKNLEEVLNEQQFLKEQFKKISFIYSYNEGVLIPAKFYAEEMKSEMIDIVYGDINTKENSVLKDFISEKEIYNVYRIPLSVHQVLTGQFPPATFLHLHSLLIKQLKQDNLLQVIFYRNLITVILSKDDELKIIQSFFYKTPEDVLYHLLNVCKQFQAKNISLQLNGFVEEDSDLIMLIKEYFTNIKFNDFIKECNCIDKIKEYPSHYFSYLFSMASCV